jgi:hypothetical protein
MMAPGMLCASLGQLQLLVCCMQIADGIAGFKVERPRILMVSSAAVERNAIIGDDLGTRFLHFLSQCICCESAAFSAAICHVPLLSVQQGVLCNY